ncbi:MAG: hypothetical protein ACI8RD_003861 [Bacillariaceae sp.]|jgi:hypothetical protein
MTTILQFLALLLYLASSSKIQLSNCLTLLRSQHQHPRQQQQPSSTTLQSLRLRRFIVVTNNYGGGRITRNSRASSLTGHHNNNEDISTGREDFNDEDDEINNSRNHHDDDKDNNNIDDKKEGDDDNNIDNNNNENPTTTILSSSSLLPSSDVSLLIDPGLWITDFMALILASQLIGLLGVINNPEFIQNGGWFQPIPAIPSTLDDLVQRISTFAILWGIAFSSTIFLVSVNTKQPSTSTTAAAEAEAAVKIKNLYPSEEKRNTTSGYRNSDRNNTTILLQRNIQTLILFGIFRIISGIILSGLHNDHNNDDVITIISSGQTSIEWLDILRDCYYIGLFTSALRYLYCRIFLF